MVGWALKMSQHRLLLAHTITSGIGHFHLDYCIWIIELSRGSTDFIMVLYWIKIDAKAHILIHGLCMI